MPYARRAVTLGEKGLGRRQLDQLDCLRPFTFHGKMNLTAFRPPFRSTGKQLRTQAGQYPRAEVILRRHAREHAQHEKQQSQHGVQGIHLALRSPLPPEPVWVPAQAVVDDADTEQTVEEIPPTREKGAPQKDVQGDVHREQGDQQQRMLDDWRLIVHDRSLAYGSFPEFWQKRSKGVGTTCIFRQYPE